MFRLSVGHKTLELPKIIARHPIVDVAAQGGDNNVLRLRAHANMLTSSTGTAPLDMHLRRDPGRRCGYIHIVQDQDDDAMGSLHHFGVASCSRLTVCCR